MLYPVPTEIQGRRLPDTPWPELPQGVELEPGDYWKYTDIDLGDHYPSNLTGTAWGFYSPDGNGCGRLVSHTVREEEDETISIRPNDGSSNSVLHEGGAQHVQWHGYVDHGVWREV